MFEDSRDDTELLDAARRGETEAYAELYRRYRPAARSAAASLRVPRCEREDVIEEAFANILAALRKGRGPSESFRPYLVAAVRNITFSRSRAHGRAMDGYIRLTTEVQAAEARADGRHRRPDHRGVRSAARAVARGARRGRDRRPPAGPARLRARHVAERGVGAGGSGPARPAHRLPRRPPARGAPALHRSRRALPSLLSVAGGAGCLPTTSAADSARAPVRVERARWHEGSVVRGAQRRHRRATATRPPRSCDRRRTAGQCQGSRSTPVFTATQNNAVEATSMTAINTGLIRRVPAHMR